MLELSKHILQKVSFDRSLFRKELLKATKWLKKDELLLFKVWCIATFGNIYGDVITEVFKSITKS